MDIWDADKLILFIAFFVPGFIALKVWHRTGHADAVLLLKGQPGQHPSLRRA